MPLLTYGQYFCQNESSDDVMNFMESLFKEAKVSALENLLDHAHRIGPIYTNRVSNKPLEFPDLELLLELPDLQLLELPDL